MYCYSESHGGGAEKKQCAELRKWALILKGQSESVWTEPAENRDLDERGRDNEKDFAWLQFGFLVQRFGVLLSCYWTQT